MKIILSRRRVLLQFIVTLITSAVITSAVISLTGCGEKNSTDMKTDSTKTKTNYKVEQFIGNYGDESYSFRSSGADYKVLSIMKTGENDVQILIRARADKKKPSCTFKSAALPVSDNVLRAVFEGTAILFTLAGDKITVTTEKPESSGVLNFFCSGGASISGTYTKTNEPLDLNIFNYTDFTKKLTKNGVTFNVYSVSNQVTSFLRIQPEGLQDNMLINHELNGFVTDAVADDLNGDGSPEVLVFTATEGMNSVTWVIGYTAVDKKIMERITYPRPEDNPVISQGFKHPSEFKVDKGKLVQTFPIYKDVTAKVPEMTGNYRQVTYNLEKHAGSWIFIVGDVLEFPINSQTDQDTIKKK